MAIGAAKNSMRGELRFGFTPSPNWLEIFSFREPDRYKLTKLNGITWAVDDPVTAIDVWAVTTPLEPTPVCVVLMPYDFTPRVDTTSPAETTIRGGLW